MYFGLLLGERLGVNHTKTQDIVQHLLLLRLCLGTQFFLFQTLQTLYILKTLSTSLDLLQFLRACTTEQFHQASG